MASLSVIGQARLDEARQWVLLNFVETYLPLRPAEDQRYQEMLVREEHQMARRQEMTWGDRKIEEGLLRGKRESVLTVLRSRFSLVPEELARQIEAVQAEAELERLLERAATVSHPDEMRAPLPN